MSVGNSEGKNPLNLPSRRVVNNWLCLCIIIHLLFVSIETNIVCVSVREREREREREICIDDQGV